MKMMNWIKKDERGFIYIIRESIDNFLTYKQLMCVQRLKSAVRHEKTSGVLAAS